MHQHQDGGLSVRRARDGRDVAEIGDQGDHEDDRRDDREDRGGVAGEAHQAGVQQDGDDGWNQGEDSGAAGVGQDDEVGIVGDQGATELIEERVGDDGSDHGAEPA